MDSHPVRWPPVPNRSRVESAGSASESRSTLRAPDEPTCVINVERAADTAAICAAFESAADGQSNGT